MKLPFAYSLKLAFYSLIFALAIRVATSPVDATSFSLGIYPPILEVIARPGAKVVFPIKIFNTGDDLSLKVALESFTAKNEAGQIELLPTAPNPYVTWVKLQSGTLSLPSEKPFFLKASQDQEFKLKIDIPENTTLADYYFVILWQSQPVFAGQETTAQTAGQIGLPVLLSVTSQDEYPVEGEISEFSSPRFLEQGPVPFTLRVKNTGRFHFAPTGTVEIKNWRGQKVSEVEILPQNILASTTRALVDIHQASPTAKLLIPDSRFLNTPLVLWSSGFLLGPYTAETKIRLTDWGPEISAQTSFWAFPVKWILGIFVGIILLVLIRRKMTSSG